MTANERREKIAKECCYELFKVISSGIDDKPEALAERWAGCHKAVTDALDSDTELLRGALETAIKCGDTQREKLAAAREALEHVVTVLGPDPGGCSECCEGCEVEMSEALHAAGAALRKIRNG